MEFGKFQEIQVLCLGLILKVYRFGNICQILPITYKIIMGRLFGTVRGVSAIEF